MNTKYQLTDHDKAYFAKWGKYPMLAQILMRKDETGEAEGIAAIKILDQNIYGIES